MASSLSGNARKYSLSLILLIRKRLVLFSAVAIATIAFFATTAITVHSESDVSYRQLNALVNSAREDIGSLPSGEDPTVYSMSFEVDKITPTPTPVVDPATDTIWLQIADCESHQNWGINTGNGYYGGLQFSQGAWDSVGGSGLPSEASKDEQIMRGKMLQQKRGWGPWGACSKKLGLR